MSEYIVNMSGDWASKQGEKLTEIVRCRDCKFCMAYMAGTYCDYMAHAIEPDGFCAWAKRKEDGDGLDAS